MQPCLEWVRKRAARPTESSGVILTVAPNGTTERANSNVDVCSEPYSLHYSRARHHPPACDHAPYMFIVPLSYFL
jgi:hypothetical protein